MKGKLAAVGKRLIYLRKLGQSSRVVNGGVYRGIKMKNHSLIKVLGIVWVASNLSAIAYADYQPTRSDGSAPEGVTISTAPRYFQPVNPSAPQSPSTPTGTRRGGCFSSESAPSIFAPKGFVGITANAQPQLTWFLPDDEPVPVEFSFYAIDASGSYELEHLQMLSYEPGINQYQPPVELQSGTRYLWQLVLQCNPNRPSSALVYEAEIEFVPMSVSAISTTATASEKAETYAMAGYWYDAISILGQGEQPDVVAMRRALLNDLAILEDAIASPEH
ncbi:protein of unknown function DUF928 [Leptolyngbya sp. PCC 7375]|nr:protein of unknown function DUF928 [Leptolyngbya sp. PCC 7375]